MGTMRPNKYDVVISGALCTVEDYVIMSQCAHNKAIHLAAEGTVSVTDISKTQNITIVGLPDYINNDFKITLYAKETQRYLCFNENWRLVGMRELQETCYFNETIVHGYFVFRSVIDLQRRVGFTHRGKAIGPKKNVTDACYLFTKIQANQFFHQHTQQQHHQAFTSPTAATAASATSTAATATSNANKSKSTRNRNKNSSNNKTNGMRNNNSNSNNYQNRQHSQGHSSNISNSNINISSTNQQLNISNIHKHQQQQQQQQHHQIRHHHNDPNVVARRHHHEHKQKRRQRNRTRATASPNPTTKTRTATATHVSQHNTATAAQETAFRTTPAADTAATKTLMQHITPTTSTTLLRSTATNGLHARSHTTSTVASKRKGRRRKGNKMHKKHQHQHEEQQQKLLSNAKDPQHRLAAYKTQTATTSATSTTQDDGDNVADYIYSSSTDYSSLSTEDSWSSYELSTTTTTAEPFDIYDYASSSTTSTSLLSSSFTPTDEFESSSVLLTTNVDSNILPTADKVSLSTINENVIASMDDNVLYASPTQEGYVKSTSTYNNSLTWTEEKYFDDFDTTNSEEPLLAPTPMLTTQNIVDSNMLLGLIMGKKIIANKILSKTTTATVDNNISDSNNSSSESFETTEEFSETEATAQTATADDKVHVTSDMSVMKENNFHEKNAAEPTSRKTTTINAYDVTRPFYFYSPTTYVATNVAPTLSTEQQQNIEYSTKLNFAAQSATSTTLLNAGATDSSGDNHTSSNRSNNLDSTSSMTENVFSTRSSNIHNKNSRHKISSSSKENTQLWFNNNNSNSSSINSNRNFGNKYKSMLHTKVNRSKVHSKAATAATAKLAATNIPTTVAESEATFISGDALEMLFAHLRTQNVASDNVNLHKNVNNKHENNTLFDFVSSNTNDLTEQFTPTSTSTAAAAYTTSTLLTTLPTTKKYLRKSTQKLLATPFHQITYVRNNAGDIDIDNIDNISVYPDILDLDVVTNNSNKNYSGSSDYNDSSQSNINSNSRMTIVSGYLPTSATATLPESIRIAKVKINKERKRMLRQRHVGGSNA